MKNYAKFYTTDLIAIYGDDALINIDDSFSSVGISIDSRTLESGNIFVALLGDTFDGHDKIDDAFKKAASAAIVSDFWFSKNSNAFIGKPFIVVKDTLIALADAARFHRFRFDIPILAIGGSNGKTTTKDITAHLLSKKFNVLKSYQNFNNRIGVPLMLLCLNEQYSIAVIEIGTNEPGEVFVLSQIIAPTAGLITNIGKEHLEKLIDLDGVEAEETSLFGWLHRKKGTCFVNLDDQRLAKYQSILNNKFTFSTISEANVTANLKISEELNPIISIEHNSNELNIKMKSVGLASGLNAVAAAAIAFYYGVPLADIKTALEDFLPEEYSSGYARMILEIIGDFYILNDCYNANPSSMRIAIDTLSRYSNRSKKIAILGDMREMGDSSALEHIELLEFAAPICDFVFTFGTEMEKATKSVNFSHISHFCSYEEMFERMKNYSEDSVFLVKASRGIKMEKLIDLVKKHLHK